MQQLQISLKTLGPLKNEQRVRILTFVFQKLNIRMSGVDGTDTKPPSDLAAVLGTKTDQTSETRSQVSDIRSLKDKKNPRTANEMVALVAYYLEHLAPDERVRDLTWDVSVRSAGSLCTTKL